MSWKEILHRWVFIFHAADGHMAIVMTTVCLRHCVPCRWSQKMWILIKTNQFVNPWIRLNRTRSWSSHRQNQNVLYSQSMDRSPHPCPFSALIRALGPLLSTSSDTGQILAILLFIFHRAQTCKRIELDSGSSNIIFHKGLLSFKKEFIMILILGRYFHFARENST